MRSLALLHQINLLEDPSNCDYVVKSFSLQISVADLPGMSEVNVPWTAA